MDDKRPHINYGERLIKLRERIKAAEIDVLLVSEPHNIFYLSGFAGGLTGAKVLLIVDSAGAVLIVDYRYFDEALEAAVADEITAWSKPGLAEAVEIAGRTGALRVGFESAHVTVEQHERILKEFKGFHMVGATDMVEPLRQIKDEYEIVRIAEAATLADRAFDYIIDYVEPGMTEREVALELDYFMLRNGAEKPSFETIIASGAHSAVPHATPSNKKIETGDFVKLDFGAVIDGYHSDMTRTLVVGKASAKQREIYLIVQEAQAAALAAVVPGKRGGEVDATAREIIENAGFGRNFSHNLGHGVGLNVHESPALGIGGKAVLEAGMVVTVEPGIYVSGFGGVRIEDLVVVDTPGPRILSHSTKRLIEL